MAPLQYKTKLYPSKIVKTSLNQFDSGLPARRHLADAHRHATAEDYGDIQGTFGRVGERRSGTILAKAQPSGRETIAGAV